MQAYLGSPLELSRGVPTIDVVVEIARGDAVVDCIGGAATDVAVDHSVLTAVGGATAAGSLGVYRDAQPVGAVIPSDAASDAAGPKRLC
jgi:hypothetical protein